MNSTKRLAAQVAGAVAISTLLGASAFAESRPLNTTEGTSSRQAYARRDDHGSNRSSDRHDTRSSNQTNRSERRSQAPVQRYDRGYVDRGPTQSGVYRNNDRSRTQADSYRYDRGRTQSENYRGGVTGRYQSDAYRNGGSQRSTFDTRGRASFDSRGRQSMRIDGRISRFTHERGGYRVWIDGGRYPIWIPEARIGLFPHLRVGLAFGVGGFYDPLGYLEAYDYYDGVGGYGVGTYGIGAYGAGAYSSGLLRGVVETVDYRRGTLVLRDDVSGNFVTAIMRDRRLESLRPGDYAEISGDWTRGGVFEALRLEDSGSGRY